MKIFDFEEMKDKNGNIIISSYHAAVGKTTLAKKFENCFDLESNCYTKIWMENLEVEKRKGRTKGSVKNPMFPHNYVSDLLNIIATHHNAIICISGHPEMLALLDGLEIKYVTVYPSDDMEALIISRCIQRGNVEPFVSDMREHYHERVELCANKTHSFSLTMELNTISSYLLAAGIALQERKIG